MHAGESLGEEDGRQDEFPAAVKNSQLVMECLPLDDEDALE
jgi:hypothetical protein